MAGKVRPLSIPGVVVIEAAGTADARGSFHEYVTEEGLREVTGSGLAVRQVSCSVSARGVLRGIAVMEVPPGQAKLVTCPKGAVLDVAVDLRAGSPAFGCWHMEQLGEDRHAALYLPAGVGHCFLALADGSAVLYLLSQAHDAAREHRVNPLDPSIGIGWPDGIGLVLSPRDAAAPGLDDALRAGFLPAYAACTGPGWPGAAPLSPQSTGTR
jgi:dTDP-4-dehydrorhamnose 3,5-epimerase